MPTLSLSSAILNWETIGSGILDILWMVVKGLIVLGIGVLIIKWLMRLSTACLKRSRLSVTLHAFILSSVKVISYVFLIIIVLSVLGIPTTSSSRPSAPRAWPSAWPSRTASPTLPAAC